MRHLYALSTSPNPDPSISYLIDKAKTYERRRCNHLPEDYPVPLSAATCLSSVVDPKDSKTNKHRYVVASQDLEVRKAMRAVMGVPLVYISRSVMIMEPMADESKSSRDRGERGKFRDGIKGRVASGTVGGKRKREGNDEGGDGEGKGEKKKLRRKGPKEPNPLSVRKPKKRVVEGEGATVAEKKEKKLIEVGLDMQLQGEADGSDPTVKRKRKRKHKSAAAGDGAAVADDGGNDQVF